VSTLARLEAALDLVDHIDPALATDQAVVAVAATQRFQRVTDLHGTILMRSKAVFGALVSTPEAVGKMGFIPPAAEPPGTRGF
jgi:hypothetical protein